jgi:hypothetical protein
MINHLKNKLIEHRFVKSVDKLKRHFFYIDMKNIYFLIFKMILNKDQKFNANIIIIIKFILVMTSS